MLTSRWLYLDLNSFFASCEQQENLSLRGLPIAVVPMKTDRTAVLAASYQAKAFGIKTGTNVGDAKKMCPGLRLVTSSHKIYIEYHHRVIEAVDSCYPVHSVCSIDEIACELTGRHYQVSEAIQLAQQIKKTLREKVGECMTVSIGVAPNMYLAKVAADMQKPDGFTLLEIETMMEKIAQLQLRDLPGVGPRMEKRLWAQGIRSMPQLLALSEMQMKGVWGSVWGARMHGLLRGQSFVFSRESGKSLSHQHVLPPVSRNYKSAYFIALRLLNKVTERLRKTKKLTRHLTIAVRFLDSTRFVQERKITNTNDTGILAQILKEIWKEVPASKKPIKVTVVVSDFVTEEAEQLSFFESPRRHGLFHVVDQINQKHGKATVYLGALQDQLSQAPTRIAFQRIPDLEEF